MRNLTKIVLIASVLFCACGSDKQNEKESTPEKEVSQTEKEPKKEMREDILTGKAQLTLGDQEFTIEDFRKNKTELTYTDQSISLRLTNASNDQFIVIQLMGEPVFETRPLTINIDQSNNESDTKARVTFMGFFNKEDIKDQVMLKKGSLIINELDEESLEVDLEFEGSGGKIMDIKNENSISMKGSIDMTLDNKVDTRSGE